MPVKMPVPSNLCGPLHVCLIVCVWRQGSSQEPVLCNLAGPRRWGSSYEAGGAAGDLHWASGGVKSHSNHCAAGLVFVAMAFSLGFGLNRYWLHSMWQLRCLKDLFYLVKHYYDNYDYIVKLYWVHYCMVKHYITFEALSWHFCPK